MDAGAPLYRVVEEYAGLGVHHRTGTDEDARTLDWFEARLRALGAAVERHAWAFDRYEATWSLTVDDRETAALPLFYEATGDVDTAAPLCATLDAAGAGAFPGWDALVARARGAGAPLAVVATRTPGGLLVVPNRAPASAPAGLPSLLVAGALAGALEGARVRARLRARVVAGRSANVVARLGAGPDRDRLVLTTPLSGWFRCAGERGTGIAVLLAVAGRLAQEGVPLLVTGNSGHELVDLGAHHLVDTGPEARGVVHFGASVAAGEPDGAGGLRLTSGLRIRAWAPGREAALAEAFAAIGQVPAAVSGADHDRPDAWLGEARAWCRLGRPLVSIAGGFPLFHAPEDVPERATTPALLARSFEAGLAAARSLAA